MEVVQSLASLKAGFNPDHTANLSVLGQPGARYTIEYSTNLLEPGTWYPLGGITLSNSTGAMKVTNSAETIFYRLKQE